MQEQDNAEEDDKCDGVEEHVLWSRPVPLGLGAL